MDDIEIQRKILTLKIIDSLKKNNMFNPKTHRIALSLYLQKDPEKQIKMLKKLEMASQLVGRFPFEEPDPQVIDGPIRLAFTEQGKPIGIFPYECHCYHPGMTGMGKSMLLRWECSQILGYGWKVWLVVNAKDMRCLKDINPNILIIWFDGSIKINPLNPCGLSKRDYLNIFSDNFILSFHMMDGCKNLILVCLRNSYDKFENSGRLPSMFDLLEEIRNYKCAPMSREGGYKSSLVNRLTGLLAGPLGSTFDCSRGIEESLFDMNCIYEIDKLTTEQQCFINNLQIINLFYHRLNQTNKDWMFVCLDDCGKLFDRSLENRPQFGLPTLAILLNTVRKSKLNIIASNQNPTNTGESILSNSAVKVMFNLSSGNDIAFMLKTFGNLTKEQKDLCYNLGRGQVIIKNSFRYPQPIFGIIPQMPEPREVSDFEASENNKLILSRLPTVIPRYDPDIRVETSQAGSVSEQRTPEQSKASNQSATPNSDDKIKTVLLDIFNRFDISSSQRAKDLGLSTQAVNRIYKAIEKEQLVEGIRLNFKGKGGLAKYHCLTKIGFEFIGKPPSKKYSGVKSFTHVFIQRYLKKHLPAVGFKEITIEKNIDGKRIDLFGKYQDQKVAVEVCISTFNYEHINVLKDFDKCDFIIIVVVDVKSKQKLEKVIYKKIPRHWKIKICVAYELLDSSKVKDFLIKQPRGLFNF